MPADVTPKKRRTQVERREKAEAKLIGAATDLVARKGFDGFSLAEVGDLAGFSRGLPGHYFGSKIELQNRVAEYVVSEFYKDAAELPVRERGIQRINDLIRHYIKVSKLERVKALTFLFTQAQIEESLKKTMTRLHNQAISTLKQEIEIGIESGNIRSDVDPLLQAGVIYTFLRGQLAFAVLDTNYETVPLGEAFISNLKQSIAAK